MNKLPTPHEATQKTDLVSCWHTVGVWGTSGKRCPKLIAIGHCRYCHVFAEAGRMMLDRDLGNEYRNELTRLVARKKPSMPSDLISGFIFRAGSEWLALASSHVHEVVETGIIHTIPHRSNHIFKGLVNVRGKLELCFSISGVLGLETATPSNGEGKEVKERLVVASRGNFRLVFPVNEALGSRRFRQAEVRNSPVTVSHSRAAFTQGIFTIEKRDVGLLNETVLFDEFEKNLA